MANKFVFAFPQDFVRNDDDLSRIIDLDETGFMQYGAHSTTMWQSTDQPLSNNAFKLNYFKERMA